MMANLRDDMVLKCDEGRKIRSYRTHVVVLSAEGTNIYPISIQCVLRLPREGAAAAFLDPSSSLFQAYVGRHLRYN
jgi:hypothetical protein